VAGGGASVSSGMSAINVRQKVVDSAPKYSSVNHSHSVNYTPLARETARSGSVFTGQRYAML